MLALGESLLGVCFSTRENCFSLLTKLPKSHFSLLHYLGVHPAVASATSACMILFTSTTATVSYIIFDLVRLRPNALSLSHTSFRT